jgi:hypothetical protein
MKNIIALTVDRPLQKRNWVKFNYTISTIFSPKLYKVLFEKKGEITYSKCQKYFNSIKKDCYVILHKFTKDDLPNFIKKEKFYELEGVEYRVRLIGITFKYIPEITTLMCLGTFTTAKYNKRFKKWYTVL